MPDTLEAPRPSVLEPEALIADPFWDQRATDALLKNAWSVHANSAWTAAYTAHWCPRFASKIDVVYYGAPIRDHSPTSAQEPLPWPYILCAARLAEYKGLDVLAMAFAEILSAENDVHLVLCGSDASEGGLSGFLSRLGISDRVHWLGQQPHGRLLELIDGCLFFVLPSRRDSLGGALIEAMAAGKAVIASRVGGIPELVRDGLDGLLVEPKNVAALTQALRLLIDDRALREHMGSSARQRSENFTWENALRRYAESWSSHPHWAAGKTVGFVLWDSSSDQTALAYSGNVSRELQRRGQKFCIALRRSHWSEPFRSELPGGTSYRLGLPTGSLFSFADPFLVLLELSWISLVEGVSVWHFLILRYRWMRGLLWFVRLSRLRPVVTLA